MRKIPWLILGLLSLRPWSNQSRCVQQWLLFFSLNTRGSQKVWYEACATCLNAVRRGLASLGGTVWKCHICVFICVAMMRSRQSDVIYPFSLLVSMERCLQYVVVTEGVKVGKTVRKRGKIKLYCCASRLFLVVPIITSIKIKPPSYMFCQKVIWLYRSIL